MIQKSKFLLEKDRPCPAGSIGNGHLGFECRHGIQMKGEPAVVRLVFGVFFRCRLSCDEYRECSLGFAQKQAVFPLKVHRTPALPVVPQLGVAVHVFR